MAGYQPHFDIDFSRGAIGEGLVQTFLNEMVGSKVEVKTDYRAHETGNVYVETWQFSKPDMSDRRPSGINVTQADFYCFASPALAGFIMIRTTALKDILAEKNPPIAYQRYTDQNTNGSEGRLVRVEHIVQRLKLFPN